jgi:hypothetical protein
VVPDGGEHRPASLLPAQELRDLHRRDDQGEGPFELERSRVGDNGIDPHPALMTARPKRGDQPRVAVEPGDLVPPSGERERHPAGAAADLEDRSPSIGRELVPEREVGGVARALDVVPDDAVVRRRAGRRPGGPAAAHSDHLGATPRSASRSRRWSSAV